MSNCKLCNGNFDFRKVQINEILGEVGITFTPRLNEIAEESMFKFCPLCGRELTDKDFKFPTNWYKDCLSCVNSFSDDSPDGDILRCMIRDGKIVREDEYCDEWN